MLGGSEGKLSRMALSGWVDGCWRVEETKSTHWTEKAFWDQKRRQAAPYNQWIRLLWSNLLSGFPGVSAVKNPPAEAGDGGQEDPLKKEMTAHSSILAWKIP